MVVPLISVRKINHMKRKELENLHAEILSCTRCRLAASRQNAVPGEGPETAAVLLLGEAPGREEDRKGRPFVGRAGVLFNDFLSTAGLNRREVYITSVIKCRPPNNRLPKKDEETACQPYLKQQIALFRPHIVVPMGKVAIDAVATVLGAELGPIGIAHGKAVTVKVPWGKIIVLPTYHPAAMTHNPRMKEPLEQDFAALKVILENNTN